MTFSEAEAPAGTRLSITVDGVTNPGSTQPTGIWTIGSYTPTGSGVDESDNSVTYATTKPGIILDMAIRADDSRINADTAYNFSYTAVNPHPTSTSIEVTIPSGLVLGAIGCTPGAGMNVSIGCSVVGRVVTLSNLFLHDVLAGEKISWSISGI